MASSVRQLFDQQRQWTKDELLPILYWSRCILALILGPLFAAIPLLGSSGLMAFVSTQLMITHTYYANYLGVNLEEMGAFTLLTEGFMPSFALFVLTWTVSYSALTT